MEDYKEKYEQALERAKVINSGTADYEVAVKIFPELKESKDDRVRKAIIDFFSEPGRKEYILNGFTVDGILAWLEKQGEHKVEPKFKVGDHISNGISEVKIVKVNDNSYSVTNDEIENDSNPANWVVYFKDQANWKLFEQNPAWSEEDERMWKNLLFLMEQENSISSWEGCYEWLKSFKEKMINVI